VRLPPPHHATWERLRQAFPELEEGRSPVPKLAGSALPLWFEGWDGPTRIALRPTPDRLEIWAGEIGDDSTCLLARATGAEPSVGLLARALGEPHPLTRVFGIRFLVPDPESCWPARPLLQGARALGPLSSLARTLDLYPGGLGVTLDWPEATPEAVRDAMAAAADFVETVSEAPPHLDAFAEAQGVFDEAEEEAGVGGAADAEADDAAGAVSLRGFRARFPRDVLGTIPPIGLKWIIGIGAVAGFFSAAAALGQVTPRWGMRSATDSPLLSSVFAGLLILAAFLAWRTLGRPRSIRSGQPWTADHPWPRLGPLVEDWRRDARLRALVAAPCLGFGLLIMSPAALEESDAACFNVGLGLIGVGAGLYQAARLAGLLARIATKGPAKLWLDPYPLHPGAEFSFRVLIPGSARLPILQATLRGYRPRMVETDEEHRIVPQVHCLRATALAGPQAVPGGASFSGRMSLPEQAAPSAHAARPGTFWELCVHGPKPRRHPDLCFLIPVYPR
jgi:hypothetical protein